MKNLFLLLLFPCLIATHNVNAEDLPDTEAGERVEETESNDSVETKAEVAAEAKAEEDGASGVTEYLVDIAGVRSFSQISKFKVRLQRKLGKRGILHEKDISRGNVKLKLVTDANPDLLSAFFREVMQSSDEAHAENLEIDDKIIRLSFTDLGK